MKIIIALVSFLFIFHKSTLSQKHNTSYLKSKPFYTKRLIDSDAVYFTSENFKIKADGSMDVSDVLQWPMYKMK